MPVDRNKLHRYRILNELLSDQSQYYTIDDLVRICTQRLIRDGFAGVSRRTIYEDLHDIETAYQTDIEWEKKHAGKRYFRYIDPGFSIPGFNTEDSDVVELRRKLSELNAIIHNLQGFDGVPMFDWVSEMNLRVKETLDGLDDSETIVSFETGNLDVAKLKFLEVIYSAIVQRKVLEVRGYSFTLKKNYKKIVSPYMLKQYNCRWYLIGKVHKSDVEVECLPLDRIDSVEDVNKRYIPYDGDVNEYYEDVIGVTVYANAKRETIKLKVADKTLPYILTRPLHGSQRQDKNSPNVIILNLIVNYELKSKIRSYGAAIEVLEPQSLREEMKREFFEALNNYNS